MVRVGAEGVGVLLHLTHPPFLYKVLFHTPPLLYKYYYPMGVG